MHGMRSTKEKNGHSVMGAIFSAGSICTYIASVGKSGAALAAASHNGLRLGRHHPGALWPDDPGL